MRRALASSPLTTGRKTVSCITARYPETDSSLLPKVTRWSSTSSKDRKVLRPRTSRRAAEGGFRSLCKSGAPGGVPHFFLAIGHSLLATRYSLLATHARDARGEGLGLIRPPVRGGQRGRFRYR